MIDANELREHIRCKHPIYAEWIDTLLRENEEMKRSLFNAKVYREKLERVAHAAEKVPTFCCAHDECVNFQTDPECHRRLTESIQALRGSK